MEEATDTEKRIDGQNLKLSSQLILNEADIERLLQTVEPNELLREAISRSKEFFSSEYAKLKALQGQQVFFSEEAVKDRGCNIKYRTLLKERHGVKTDRETRQLSVADKALAMMLAHNARINVLMGKYRTECELKAKAKQEGKTY